MRGGGSQRTGASRLALSWEGPARLRAGGWPTCRRVSSRPKASLGSAPNMTSCSASSGPGSSKSFRGRPRSAIARRMPIISTARSGCARSTAGSAHLARIMKAAKVVDPATQQARDQVRFGATVELADEDGERRAVTIVGDDETDAAAGRIGWSAPLARALIGARVGDERIVRLPAGEKSYEVMRISYPRARRRGSGSRRCAAARPAWSRPRCRRSPSRPRGRRRARRCRRSAATATSGCRCWRTALEAPAHKPRHRTRIGSSPRITRDQDWPPRSSSRRSWTSAPTSK